MEVHDFSCAIHSKEPDQCLTVSFPTDLEIIEVVGPMHTEGCIDNPNIVKSLSSGPDSFLPRETIAVYMDDSSSDGGSSLYGCCVAYLFMFSHKTGKLGRIRRDTYSWNIWGFDRTPDYYEQCLNDSNTEDASVWYPSKYIRSYDKIRVVAVCELCYDFFFKKFNKESELHQSSRYYRVVADNLGLELPNVKSKKDAYKILRRHIFNMFNFTDYLDKKSTK